MTQAFLDLIRSSPNVLIYASTPTCAPCRAIGPIVARFADEHKGEIEVIKVDASNPTVAKALNVQAVPAFIAFRHGTEFGRILGSRVTREKLAEVAGL